MKKANAAKAIPIHTRQGKKVGSHSVNPVPNGQFQAAKPKGMKVDDHKPTMTGKNTPDKGAR